MKKLLSFLAVVLISTVAFAQSVTLTFTAKDAANQHVQLNRVSITNLTKGWQETIYWPDTTLTMQNGTGIANVETCHGASLQLSQNNPNPFTGTTEVSLMVATEGTITMDIADINGRIVETWCTASLQPGTHQFRITLATAGTYVMTARQNGQTSFIKMVCNGGTDANKMEYIGTVEMHGRASLQLPKSQNAPKYTTTHPFSFGDQMEYVGYAIINGTEAESQHITQAQNASQAIILQFAEIGGGTSQDGQPCSGSATVTDIDNNIYNTVQIGNQCWMKENLRTTRYANGTSIALGSSTSTTTPYRYYPNADQSNVSTYGYLYNWKAVMGSSTSSSANPSGVQGICPTGWHVPSDVEWTQLTDYVSSQSQYVCGGNNSYIAKALASTTGWSNSTNTCDVGNNPSSNNATGFSAFPAGGYQYNSGVYISFGYLTRFWSATKTIGNPYYRELRGDYAYVVRSGDEDYNGHSVRCVNDNSSGACLPVVTTNIVSNITTTTASCGGNVIFDGGATVTARGVCWSTVHNPTTSNNHTTNGTGTGSFTSSLTGLTIGTTYYVRAYATNSVGTAYGEEVSFVAALLPVVNTATPTNIMGTSAICGGNVTSDGGATVIARGVCWSTSPNPTIISSHTTNGTGTGSFTSSLTGLTIGTTYYIRAYATNSVGTTYGEEVSIITPNFPTVFTNTIPIITSTSATCGGNVTSDGGATVTARGVCWSTSHNPTIISYHTTDGTGTGSFTSNITGLNAHTTYYVRAYATNSTGTSYGTERSFTTHNNNDDGQPCPGVAIVTDIDNNTYNTVQIGNQCWMRENLRTIRYTNGTYIALGSSTSTTTAYRYYPNNNSSNVSTYGYLYNWKAVMGNSSSSSTNPSGVQGICPTGWHVPSYAEWTQLIDYVISQSQYVCGDNNTYIAKALASTIGWDSYSYTCAVGDNPNANNATGFSALPAGIYYGDYDRFGNSAHFWSATEMNDVNHAHGPYLYTASTYVHVTGGNYKAFGVSVRCVRDENGSSTIQLPTITTSLVSNVAETSASCGGNVTSDGGASITARGVCWSTLQNPTISGSHTTDGIGTGSFTSNITGLSFNTTYYVRAYATNSVGTAYGNEVSFTTSNSGTSQDGQPCSGSATVTDIDNNIYNTVQIGNQCWLKENLRTSRYANGMSIALGSCTSTTTAYRYYPDNNSSNVPSYGYLYNWKAVMGNSSSSWTNPSGVQGICPTGWHVPSDAEWTQLTNYVSSQSQYVCGGASTYIAKSLASTTGWYSNTVTCNVGYAPSSNNATGFSVLPAGKYYGDYSLFGYSTELWSATDGYDDTAAYYRGLYSFGNSVGRYSSLKDAGRSVRCLRD